MKPIRKQGFGLIEILISILIISIGVVGVTSFQKVYRVKSMEADQHLTAFQLAQEVLDDLKGATDFSQIVTDTSPASSPGDLFGDVTVGNTTFTRSWVVEPMDPSVLAAGADGQPKIVTVKVVWEGLRKKGEIKIQGIFSPHNTFSSSKIANGGKLEFPDQGGANGVQPWSASTDYKKDDKTLGIDNQVYKCKVPGWCKQSAYVPGSIMIPVIWQSAWAPVTQS